VTRPAGWKRMYILSKNHESQGREGGKLENVENPPTKKKELKRSRTAGEFTPKEGKVKRPAEEIPTNSGEKEYRDLKGVVPHILGPPKKPKQEMWISLRQ